MIKIIWAFALTIICTNAFLSTAFAQFQENFNDGSLTTNPEWQGAKSDFTVQSGHLQLQAPPEPGQSWLTTPSQAIRNATWEFDIRMEFNPSDANHARVYLTAAQQDLTGPVEGYYVLVGGRADEVSLYRQDFDNAVKIIDGIDGTTDVPEVNLRIRVTRDSGGNWQLYSGLLSGEEFVLQGGATDLTYATSSYFGILCEYTSTRADAFHFDDIMVTGDPEPAPAPEPGYKDVIITEILADPSPAVELPEVEFVEIHNRTTGPFSLGGCTITDGSSDGILPGIVLEAGAYLILTSQGTADIFDSAAPVAGIAGMPSLNNSGESLVLRAQNGDMIDSVNYAPSWYRGASPADGGWTLELIDPENTCGEEENWTSSQDPFGGTPGRQNSVFASRPDQTAPEVTQVIAVDRSHVRIYFNEKLAKEPVPTRDILFDPPVNVAGVSFADQSLRALDVELGETLELRTLYSVTVQRVRDCARNMIEESQEATRFAMPEEADSLDVVINEILFNPRPGGADFVELFNRSPKYINLNNWGIGAYSDGRAGDTKLISAHDLLLQPGDFLVLTSDPDVIANHYPGISGHLLIKASLPSLPDDAGSVAVVNAAGKVVDALAYSSDWHSTFLISEDGVSLERVSAEGASHEPQNWNSASTVEGSATPGIENSNVRKELLVPDNAITIDPLVFRPMSAQNNFALVRYKFDQGGYVANVRVLDPHGRTIKMLASNDLLGTRGFYTWEGDRDDGGRARVGYYWLWFEVFHSSGQVATFRERIIIAGEF